MVSAPEVTRILLPDIVGSTASRPTEHHKSPLIFQEIDTRGSCAARASHPKRSRHGRASDGVRCARQPLLSTTHPIHRRLALDY